MINEDRAVRGEKAALAGIWGNVLLSLLKLIVGFVANSTAVIADAIHSFSDILTSALTWLGIRVSKRPPDKEHPYGHGDVEPIVGLIISIVLAVIGFEFARHSIGEIYIKVTAPGPLAIYATILALILKEAMSRYVINVAEHINSPALKADAQHHRSDVYSSIVVLIGVIGARLGYPMLDPLVGVIVSLIIIKIGFDVGRENIRQLMGTVPSPELSTRIENLVLGMNKVKLIHRIRIHGMGAYFIVDLHVCVDHSLPLGEAHKIAHEVQRKIVDLFPEVSSALVHIEPYDAYHKKNIKRGRGRV